MGREVRLGHSELPLTFTPLLRFPFYLQCSCSSLKVPSLRDATYSTDWKDSSIDMTLSNPFWKAQPQQGMYVIYVCMLTKRTVETAFVHKL